MQSFNRLWLPDFSVAIRCAVCRSSKARRVRSPSLCALLSQVSRQRVSAGESLPPKEGDRGSDLSSIPVDTNKLSCSAAIPRCQKTAGVGIDARVQVELLRQIFGKPVRRGNVMGHIWSNLGNPPFAQRVRFRFSPEESRRLFGKPLDQPPCDDPGGKPATGRNCSPRRYSTIAGESGEDPQSRYGWQNPAETNLQIERMADVAQTMSRGRTAILGLWVAIQRHGASSGSMDRNPSSAGELGRTDAMDHGDFSGRHADQ